MGNSLLERIKKSKLDARMRKQAQRYLVRIQMGHLSEALKIIGEIAKTSRLRKRVEASSATARRSFERLQRCLKGGPWEAEFDRAVRKVRNKNAFHYDEELTREAVRQTAQDSKLRQLTVGEDIHSSRFHFADDVLNVMVYRCLWGLVDQPTVNTEADRVSAWAFERFKDLLQFSAELWVYLSFCKFL
jgi:hypothetical protein